MEKSLSERRLENENYYLREGSTLIRCSKCRGTFQEPILATVSSRGSVQTYNACPRCLSEITAPRHDKKEKGGETSISVENVKKVAVKHEDDVKCGHFLGYLKKRPRDTPFPDECLTCDKMIECLTH